MVAAKDDDLAVGRDGLAFLDPVLLVAGGFGYTFNITNVNSSANKITSPTNRSLVVVLD